jgi:hypothetical protein
LDNDFQDHRLRRSSYPDFSLCTLNLLSATNAAQGTTAEGVAVGDLPGWKRQSDQAIINLFRHYGGGQAGRKRCAQRAVEQTLQLIARHL